MKPRAGDTLPDSAHETVAVIPLRDPGRGKTRLSPVLDHDDRAELVTAIFRDVARVLKASSAERVVVAASGPEAAALAREEALGVVLDPSPGGLDRAIAQATNAYADAQGLLTVVADLPGLRVEEVERLLATDTDVTVAPTADGGTGGLLRRPPRVMPTAYGPWSARRHVEHARRRGLRTATLVLPGFQRDVDTPDDLADLLDQPVGPATARVLARLADRLNAAREAAPPRRGS